MVDLKDNQYFYQLMLWLMSIKGIGRATVRKVVDQVNDPEKVLYGGLEDIALLERVTGRPGRFLLNSRNFDYCEKVWLKAQSTSDYVLGIWDDAYPEALKQINDPPVVLHCRGNYQWLSAAFNGIGVVGTRSPSEYGRQYGFDLSAQIAKRGEAIISGMAMGIDAVAHLGALQAKGKTVAVLGCGVNICYPKYNSKLYQQLSKEGLIVSEYQADAPAQSMHFPERNRIIAGLSRSCLVIEAAKKSGSLITAEMVIDLGREVYALPGPLYSAKSAGCHWLMREGASPIVDLETLLSDLSLKTVNLGMQVERSKIAEHPIVSILAKEGALTLDMLHAKSGLPIQELIVILESLKSENYVKNSGFLYHI